jgi:hypothetical protein
MRLSWLILVWVAMVILGSCQSQKTQLNKVPQKVEVADNYLANQAIEVTNDNLKGQEKRKKRHSKQAETQQKDLNELNKSPYKVKKKNVNKRVYDIY